MQEQTIYWRHKPEGVLGEFVECLWYWQAPAMPHARERLLPTGTAELVINLAEDRIALPGRNGTADRVLPGSLVSGAHSEFFEIETVSERHVAGVHFKAGGAFPFLGARADELHNERAPLEALWGARAGALRTRLLEARTVEERFRVMEEALLAAARLRPGRRAKKEWTERHPAVVHALREFQGEPHARTIAEVTRQTGLSPRRFIELFSEEVGLTPKLFCRVRRFQRVLNHVARHERIHWVDLALACGYFDQAHFIRDFRAFSGINPTAYLVVHTENVNHVPLRD
jgi:methylphosphotriester-DNA--protein-cysteine methyltransferase